MISVDAGWVTIILVLSACDKKYGFIGSSMEDLPPDSPGTLQSDEVIELESKAGILRIRFWEFDQLRWIDQQRELRKHKIKIDTILEMQTRQRWRKNFSVYSKLSEYWNFTKVFYIGYYLTYLTALTTMNYHATNYQTLRSWGVIIKLEKSLKI